MTPATRLREAREARGWSQAELATRAGTTQQTVDRLERGVTSFSRALPAVAAALDLDLEELSAGSALLDQSASAAKPATSRLDSYSEAGLKARINERLDALGLTQITAATKAGLPRDTLRNLFRVGGAPRIDTLIKIAAALETTVGWLIGESSAALPPARPTVRLGFDGQVSPTSAAHILAIIEADK